LNDDEGVIDSAFDDTGPFRVSPESGGVSLETALRDFGPAAIDDLIPRIRAIARRLDAAHRAGLVHGALHPSKVFVNDEATSVIAGTAARVPYAAPEVIDGKDATPLSDQYSLAAIAYEWLFGRPIAHGGDRPTEVRAMPGVDRQALSKAFTRALAQKPGDRFASCGAFCDAFAAAVVPELPLLGDPEAVAAAAREADAADVDDFAPEDPPEAPPISAADLAELPALTVDDVKIVPEPSIMTAVQPDLAPIIPVPDLPVAAPPPPPPITPVPAWDPPVLSSARPTMESPRFGAFALFFAVIVGAVFGFAAGYMARPRALQSGPPQTMASAPPADAPDRGASSALGAPSTSGAAPKAPESPAPKAPAPEAPAPEASKSPVNPGRLLVRSFPSGASVTVDGVARGETPLALRDLDIGTRNVIVNRPGYVAQTLKVSITKARPARTLDVRLAAAPAPASPKPGESGAPRPGTPATLGKPAVSTGSLTVDSRPPGAAVTINGKPSGTTPLTINDLAPGEYQIVMTMPGYRNVTTTVRVVAGERARAAASLTAVEQQ